MSFKEIMLAKWKVWKPALIGFVVGIIVGPFISGFFGWQVTSTTMRDQVHNALVSQEASVCNWRARQEVADPAALDFSKRESLAQKYGQLPWQSQADYDVISACADLLSQHQTNNQGAQPHA